MENESQGNMLDTCNWTLLVENENYTSYTCTCDSVLNFYYVKKHGADQSAKCIFMWILIHFALQPTGFPNSIDLGCAAYLWESNQLLKWIIFLLSILFLRHIASCRNLLSFKQKVLQWLLKSFKEIKKKLHYHERLQQTSRRQLLTH